MRIVYRLFAFACLSIAGFSACASDNVAIETTGIEAAPQTTVIRYNAKDIAALPLGEFVHFDLNFQNTIYVLTYTNPADLDHVLVARSDVQYVLGDRIPATQNTQSDTLKEVVISGDDPAIESAEGGCPATESVEGGCDVVCNCPCCQLVNGVKVCC